MQIVDVLARKDANNQRDDIRRWAFENDIEIFRFDFVYGPKVQPNMWRVFLSSNDPKEAVALKLRWG